MHFTCRKLLFFVHPLLLLLCFSCEEPGKEQSCVAPGAIEGRKVAIVRFRQEDPDHLFLKRPKGRPRQEEITASGG